MLSPSTSVSFKGCSVSKKKPKLLIDADLIVYRSCIAVEQDARFDDDFHILYSSFDDAWQNVNIAMTRLFERFGTDDHVAALSVGRNFRYDVDPTYKGNRTETRKPLCFARVREALEAHYTVYKFDGLEADDVLGIFATRDPNTIICSMDKDLKTIPCTLWDGKQVRKIEQHEADFWFMYQVLVGDTADGYPGCPGVGDVKARKILCGKPEEGPEVVWSLVVAAYEKAGLTEDDAIKQARLARILRNSDWDAKAKRPILWTP